MGSSEIISEIYGLFECKDLQARISAITCNARQDRYAWIVQRMLSNLDIADLEDSDLIILMTCGKCDRCVVDRLPQEALVKVYEDALCGLSEDLLDGAKSVYDSKRHNDAERHRARNRQQLIKEGMNEHE